MQKTDEQLKRNLSVRLLNMIAIGGALGTGIFLASGSAIHQAGPGGTMVAYSITGLMVYFLMMSLGEMAAFMPTTGSFYAYAARFVDPAFGYALGWNYWYTWAVTVASELSAASLVMQFWFPEVPLTYWSALFLAVFVGLNFLSAKGFGEAEYWFSLIKVLAIIVFILAGAGLVLGLFGGKAIGFQNWRVADAPFPGGIFAIFGAFVVSGFSFQGTELIGVAAGESENPHINIPRAIKQVFWRILIFFILSLFIISLLIPYTSPLLMGNEVALSPFTLVFKNVGIPFAASIMNAIILIAILSAGNSGMYASTRMLWYLSKKGHIPHFFAKVNRGGVPIHALLATTLVAMLTFLSSFFGNGTVYIWLLSASSLSGFIAWLGIAVSHYRFRKAYLFQGRDLKDLPYVAIGYPYAPLLAFALCVVVIAGQNIEAFRGPHIDWSGILIAYISLPLFLILWLGYKIIHRTKIVALKDCSFAKAEEDD